MSEATQKPAKILLIEDEKRIADFLQRGLESNNYAVEHTLEGAACLEKLHETDYDLVILDLMLPDMDGLAVLEKIRNRKVSPPVAPVFASLPTPTAELSLTSSTVDTVASSDWIRPTTAPPASITTIPGARPSLLPLFRISVRGRTSEMSRTITRAGVES